MAKINVESCQKALDRYLGSSAGKAAVSKYRRDALTGKSSSRGIGIHTIGETINKFAELIWKAECASDLTADALYALSHVDLVNSTPEELPDGSFRVRMWFEDNSFHPSLYKAKYGGVDNIANLLDEGYHARDYVYGVWKGHEELGRIPSMPDREGANFVQKAMDELKNKYGKEYGVISIKKLP